MTLMTYIHTMPERDRDRGTQTNTEEDNATDKRRRFGDTDYRTESDKR